MAKEFKNAVKFDKKQLDNTELRYFRENALFRFRIPPPQSSMIQPCSFCFVVACVMIQVLKIIISLLELVQFKNKPKIFMMQFQMNPRFF